MNDLVLHLDKVKKKFGNLIALNDISFSIKRQEIVGLVGPNGAGKTTALKLIARLLKPNAGRICIRNKNGNLQEINKNSIELVEIGYLIDIPQFYDTKINSLLKYICNIRDYPKHKIEQRINFLLKEFNLYRWKYKNIKTLSKGMSHKLGFVVSIINEPEFIILDEPQTGLDPESRIKIREYLKNLKDEERTILISSHLLNEIREISDKIAILNKGNLVGFDAIDNLEREFKIKQVVCEIDEKVSPEKVESLLINISKNISKFCGENKEELSQSRLITYNPEIPAFIINYDGFRESKSKILEILTNEFRTEFTINSFYEPKLSQIEKLYSQTSKESNMELNKD